MPKLTCQDLRKILPQDNPFVFIDYVEDYKEGEWLTAVKNISADEWSTPQNRKGGTRFPDTLLIEAAAQASLVLYHVTRINDSSRKPQYFIGKIDAEFIESAMIGDSLQIKVEAGKLLDAGGYANVDVIANNNLKAKIALFFGVK